MTETQGETEAAPREEGGVYAGIGSRRTPARVLAVMTRTAAELGKRGWMLRSGGARGADAAFERGAAETPAGAEIFLPWNGFGERLPRTGRREAAVNREAEEETARHHPAWQDLSRGVRKLMARNAQIILGRRPLSRPLPVRFVIGWTPGSTAREQGGTGQGYRIALWQGIPVCDLRSSAEWSLGETDVPDEVKKILREAAELCRGVR